MILYTPFLIHHDTQRHDNTSMNKEKLNDIFLSTLTIYIYIYTLVRVRNLYYYFDFFIDLIIVDGPHITSHEVV